MQTYIFACVHNAGRSQMAASFFNQLADPQKARAVSAGPSLVRVSILSFWRSWKRLALIYPTPNRSF